nr:DUF2573 family protein [Bacillus sp. UNC438CL73TsuS30]
MEKRFLQQFEAILDKYSELLVGVSDAETKEKVKIWALYTHIAKSMPALAKHWNSMYPEAKEQMKEIAGEIKRMNEEHRKK